MLAGRQPASNSLYLQVREESVYKGLDQSVKNYLVSVPLVADLRSPAMRPRHWEALMEATGVSRHGLRGAE